MTFQSQTPHDELDPTNFVAGQLVEAAREYVGVKWKHRGRSKAGIDCVGLIALAGKSCGLHEFTDDVSYTRQSVGQDLLAPFRQHAVEVRLGPDTSLYDLHDADMLILRDKIFPQHAGIVASRDGRKTLIHSSAFYGKTVEEFIRESHEKSAITAFRFRFLT